MWTYRCYNDGHQLTLWQRWYNDNTEFHGTHDAVFRTLEQQAQWKEPYAKLLDKKMRLFEIRLQGNPKHRLIGFYGPERMQFTIVATCTHKQNVYDPPDVKATARKRKKEIESNPAKAIPCVRPSGIIKV